MKAAPSYEEEVYGRSREARYRRNVYDPSREAYERGRLVSPGSDIYDYPGWWTPKGPLSARLCKTPAFFVARNAMRLCELLGLKAAVDYLHPQRQIFAYQDLRDKGHLSFAERQSLHLLRHAAADLAKIVPPEIIIYPPGEYSLQLPNGQLQPLERYASYATVRSHPGFVSLTRDYLDSRKISRMRALGTTLHEFSHARHRDGAWILALVLAVNGTAVGAMARGVFSLVRPGGRSWRQSLRSAGITGVLAATGHLAGLHAVFWLRRRAEFRADAESARDMGTAKHRLAEIEHNGVFPEGNSPEWLVRIGDSHPLDSSRIERLQQLERELTTDQPTPLPYLEKMTHTAADRDGHLRVSEPPRWTADDVAAIKTPLPERPPAPSYVSMYGAGLDL